ncbi:MAG: glycosyl hydrolase [Gammaproteobacteria bacterium]|nr:MAG: glycosyl hydrolase [Gammaproteobacteria bacterium]
MSSMLWIGTRKGLFALRADGARRSWKLAGPQFLGHIIHHVVQDPREPRTLLMAAKTGHLGPTVFRSGDRGRSWREAAQPPAFRKALEGEEARAVQRVFWLTPGHRNETGTWYAGSSPAGLFRSSDGGERWEPVAGFNDNPMRPKWAAFPTPDGEFLHSILVDPRDARHLYIAISIGGVFESTDAGASWTPLNEGIAADFLPEPNVPFGHDPHCVVQHPAKPDRLYQQNHCGIYRLDRPERRWQRIGTAMPKKIGDIGFPIVVHPGDPDAAWVLPMDGQTVWPRTSIGGKPAVYATRDGGASWRRLDRGLPRSQAWFTVLRQAMCADAHERAGLYFGTTAGEVWASTNGGGNWRCLARHLPEIYSVSHAA